MREGEIHMYVWPTKKKLMEAIVEVLSTKDTLSTALINDEVATLLNLSKELLEEEDINCSGTAYSYKMRWARTELKQKGIIINPKRGYWSLIRH